MDKQIHKYNFLKDLKDKEESILKYYRRISNSEKPQPKIIPKQKRLTKKNAFKLEISKEINKEGGEHREHSEEDKEDKEEREKKIADNMKKLTKKNIVIMDD